jgi:hypothetical protein
MASIELIDGDFQLGKYSFYHYPPKRVSAELVYSEPGKFWPSTSKIDFVADLEVAELIDQESKIVRFNAALRDGRNFTAKTDAKTWQKIGALIAEKKKTPDERARDSRNKNISMAIALVGILALGSLVAIAASNTPDSSSSTTRDSSDGKHIRAGVSHHASSPREDGVFVTKEGYVAAATKEDYDEATTYATQGDKEAFAQMVDSGRIVTLDPHREVYIMEHAGFLGAEVKIRPKGERITVWTTIEALTPKL